MKYNFNFLIDNKLSVYCENETERKMLMKACEELNYYDSFCLITDYVTCFYFKFRKEDDKVVISRILSEKNYIPFKEWIKLGKW